jgi:protease YdgD
MQGLIYAFFILFALSTAQAQEPKMGILGSIDNREASSYGDIDSASLQNIGQLQMKQPGKNGVCSGALVAPDIVITAGHCINHPGNQPFTAEQMEFWLQYNGGGNQPEHKIFKVRQVLVYPKWLENATSRNDLGVVVLDRKAPVDGAPLATLDELQDAVNAAKAKPLLLVAGYPGSKGGRLYFAHSSEYGLTDGRVILHTADMEKGQSGGPVFWGNKVVGIHSFISTERNGSLGFDNEMKAQIRSWITAYSRY